MAQSSIYNSPMRSLNNRCALTLFTGKVQHSAVSENYEEGRECNSCAKYGQIMHESNS